MYFTQTVIFLIACICYTNAQTYLFTDNFDNGVSQWTIYDPQGSITSNSLHSISGQSIRLRDDASITKAISTAGETDVFIKYSLAAGVLENRDWCYFEVSINGGQSWQTILSLTNGQDNNVFSVGTYQHNTLDDNANLQIRYRSVGSGADNCYVEDTEIYTLSGRSLLTKASLLNGVNPGDVIPTYAYVPATGSSSAANTFEGTLSFTPTTGQIDITVDTFGDLASSGNEVLPAFSFDFVQDNGNLIPVEQARVTTSHQRWEYIIGAGAVWDEVDDGTYSRASFPFTLVEKNANCVHNGMMTFLFKASGSAVSHISYQIASETCLYAKANFWGMVSATYTAGTVSNKAAVISEYNAEVAARIPTFDINDIGTHYPGTNPSSFASEINSQHMSSYGVLYNNKHFVNVPETRQGSYPYPDSMVLPSYSTAKSTGASLALMRLAQKYPSDNVFSIKVDTLVPACNLGKWSLVTLNDLADMSTGLYASNRYMIDEGNSDSASYSWFLELDHAAKIDWACTNYNKKANPQTKWVYHTTDTYILAAALDNFIMDKEGKSYYEFLNDEVYGPNGQSKMMMNSGHVTYDTEEKPFGGYGMFYTRDDVAKVSTLYQNDGKIGTTQVLHQSSVLATLQKDSSDTGMDIQSLSGFKYNNAFWAKDITYSGCSSGYVPFMSGYGGITVAILPNEVTYYYFSDNDEFGWEASTQATSTISALC